MSGLLRPHMTKLAAIFKLVDASLIIACYVAVHINKELAWQEKDSFFLLLAIVIYFAFATKHELYRSWRISSVLRELFNICLLWCYTIITLVFLGYLLKQLEDIHRQLLLYWLITTPLAICCWHVLARKVSHFLRVRNYNSRSVAIIGYSALSQKVADTVNNASWMGLNFCGYYDDRFQNGCRETDVSVDDAFVKGSVNDLVELAKSGELDIVYIALPIFAERRIQEILHALCDTTVNVYLAHDFESYSILSGRWDMLGQIPVMSIHESPFEGVSGWTKRLEDIILCIPILLIIAIPCLIISVLIKLESPGPIIFKQKRYGLNGKEFTIWKFRSMTNTPEDKEVQQATRDDPRTTRLGRFLRMTSLDELPQFINVLTGKMSIIGPRPHAVVHNTKYRKIVNRYMLRHTVKPGITGWAQVNGFRGETKTLDKMQKRVEFDLYYIRHWTVMFDLKIIFLTIKSCLKNKDVY